MSAARCESHGKICHGKICAPRRRREEEEEEERKKKKKKKKKKEEEEEEEEERSILPKYLGKPSLTELLVVKKKRCPSRNFREATTFLQKGAHHPSGVCQSSAAPPDLAGAVPAQLRSHSTPPISPLTCRCPPTTDALMSPGGRVYLEDKGHLETLSTQAGGQELNDLQEEPLALFGDDIPGMEGLGTDITVICPWEAFSHLELHELAQFGII
ncbi:hypothetical protein DUI87_20459 [Hirundo rustica rustica]|uniref:Retinal cone rhodopsin-sensitive cGMP 3',5'-cyclic phosphodiesterase subunit gamma n=1 Tax=Hirundo rustica rustica TaxID=333673 RepID=A0A3M0JVU0_HIRRU|nr:hypothetical protein DUI87_20459 [Hirundo rustica rustica]